MGKIRDDIVSYALSKTAQKLAKITRFPHLEQEAKELANNTVTSKVVTGGKIVSISGASLWTGNKIVDLVKDPTVKEEDLVRPIIKDRPKVIVPPSNSKY